MNKLVVHGLCLMSDLATRPIFVADDADDVLFNQPNQ